jgi:hypothetical protein
LLVIPSAHAPGLIWLGETHCIIVSDSVTAGTYAEEASKKQ